MNAKKILIQAIPLLILFSMTGCQHVQTMSTPNPVTVQDFGCQGDEPCMYAPYCHP